ncbi:MAG: DinB family protein [Geobacteraceae bacterium]
MSTPEGAQLAQKIRLNVEEFKKTCAGIDEATASRATGDRWSPKQIVSHLCGPEGTGFIPTIRAILDQDTPRLDIEAENPFFTGKRISMTMAELLAEFEREYGRMAEVVEDLTPEQLDRKAQIPLLKESPFGEYPTLAEWVGVLADFHIDFHISHMKEILRELE